MESSASDRRVSGKKLVLFLLISVVTLIVGMTSARLLVQQPLKPLPRLGASLPTVILESPTGQTRPSTDFSGKVILLDLQPQGCTTPCEQRNRLMNQFSHMNEPVGASLLQLTLREKPYPADLLKSRSQTARPPWYWYLVDTEALQALNALRASPEDQSFILLDRKGEVRGRYPINDHEKHKEMMLDIRSLVTEAP